MDVIDQLRELINQRFDGVDRRLDELTVQVKETNGRVRLHDRQIASLEQANTNTKDEFGRHARNVHDIRDDLQTMNLRVAAMQLSPPAHNEDPERTAVTYYTLGRIIAIVVGTASLSVTVTWFIATHLK